MYHFIDRRVLFMIREIRALLAGDKYAHFAGLGETTAAQPEPEAVPDETCQELLPLALTLIERGDRPCKNIIIALGPIAYFWDVVAGVSNRLSQAIIFPRPGFIRCCCCCNSCCCCGGVCCCSFCSVRGRGRGSRCHPSLLDGRTRIGRGIGIGRGCAGVKAAPEIPLIGRPGGRGFWCKCPTL